MYDVIIVGSGPAGSSAAIYTSRAGLSTTIIAGANPGGLVATTDQVDNYLGMNGMSGVDMAEKFNDHAVAFGAELFYDEVKSIEKHADVFYVHTEGEELLSARSVIYAAGSTPKKLGVPGEDLPGVSYCATCDGNFFKNVPVVVIGGGEVAAEDALYLSHLSSSVTVLIRSEWRATPPAVEKLVAQENVTIREGVIVSEILGDEGKVSAVRLLDGSILDTKGVFVAIGQSPNSGVAGEHVVLFEDRFIEHSSVPGFLVAGDICNRDYRQIAIAVGDGARAGIDATAYLQAV